MVGTYVLFIRIILIIDKVVCKDKTCFIIFYKDINYMYLVFFPFIEMFYEMYQEFLWFSKTSIFSMSV